MYIYSMGLCFQLGIKHNGIACSSCDCTLYGIRWKCTECDNVDLCTKCYMSDEVYKECEFVRIERESTQRYVYNILILVMEICVDS